MPAEAFEMEAGAGGPPQRVAEVSLQEIPLKAVLMIAGVCVLFQTLFGVITMRNTGGTWGAVDDMHNYWKDADHTSPLPAPRPPGPRPTPSPPDNSGDDESKCGGLWAEGMGLGYKMDQFQKVHEEYKTDFMTLWTNPKRDSSVYMEFDIGSIRAAPLQLGIAALNMRGPMAHFDAGDKGDYYFEISHSPDESGVDVKLIDLSQRSEDGNYADVWSAGRVPSGVIRMTALGNRTEKDGDGGCKIVSTLVDATSFVNAGMYVIDEEEYQTYGAARIELNTVKSFGGNLDFTMFYGETVIRFCMFKLPEPKMPPRMADDRVGYFLTEFQMLGDYRGRGLHAERPEAEMNPVVRMINKQWPQRKKGETTIHYYVDPTVPEPFHVATMEGVMRWAPAFAKVGMKIEAHAPSKRETWPEDYDVADIHFNSISWAPGDGQHVFAIGQSVVDPRTSEVLKANIIFTLGWLESWLGEKLFYAATADLPMRRASSVAARRLEEADDHELTRRRSRRPAAPGREPRRRGEGAVAELLLPPAGERERLHEAVCNYRSKGPSLRHHHPHEGLVCRALHDNSAKVWWELQPRTSAEAEEFLRLGIADVTSHEVGHTLGLRHNFRGSTAVTYEQSQDPDYVKEHGLSASVMDYVPVNIVSGRKKDLPYFTPVVGEYDKWAIEYGYMTVEGETMGAKHPDVAKVAAEYSTKQFTFATDEDADAFDPYTRRFDMTSTPVKFAQEQLKLVSNSFQSFWNRAIKKGERYHQVHRSIARLLRHSERAASNLVEFLGGIKMARRHSKEGCSAEDTQACKEQHLFSVPSSEMTDALQELGKYFDSFPGLELDVDDMQKFAVMAGRGWAEFLGAEPFDLREAILVQKSNVLDHLLQPTRLERLRLSESIRDDGAGPLDGSSAISSLLQVLSEKILGVKPGTYFRNGDSNTFDDVAIEEVKKVMRDPHRHDLQFEFIDFMELVREYEFGYFRAPYVGAAITGEMIRLRPMLEKVYESIVRKDTPDLSTGLQLGAITHMLKTLDAPMFEGDIDTATDDTERPVG